MSFTKKELVECAVREGQKRRENYPKWIRERRMNQRTADVEIARMHAIYQVLMCLPDDFIHGAQQ